MITVRTYLDNVQPLSYSWFDLDSLYDHDSDVRLVIRLAQSKVGREIGKNRQLPPNKTSEVAMIVDARKAVPWHLKAAVYDLDSCRSWSNKDAWRISQNVETSTRSALRDGACV